MKASLQLALRAVESRVVGGASLTNRGRRVWTRVLLIDYQLSDTDIMAVEGGMEADLSGLSFQELQALCQAVGLELEVWSKEAMVASLRAHAEASSNNSNGYWTGGVRSLRSTTGESNDVFKRSREEAQRGVNERETMNVREEEEERQEGTGGASDGGGGSSGESTAVEGGVRKKPKEEGEEQEAVAAAILPQVAQDNVHAPLDLSATSVLTFVVHTHNKGNPFCYEASKLLLRTCKAFQQDKSFLLGAVKYPDLVVTRTPGQLPKELRPNFRRRWCGMSLLKEELSAAEILAFYTNTIALRTKIIQEANREAFLPESQQDAQFLIKHTPSRDGGACVVKGAVVLQVLKPAPEVGGRGGRYMIIPPEALMAGALMLPFDRVLACCLTPARTRVRYFEVRVVGCYRTRWSVGLVPRAAVDALLLVPGDVGTIGTSSVGIVFREGALYVTHSQTELEEDDGVERIVGIGLDEEDMEVFLTIDGKYRGVVADKQAVETALFGEIMREGPLDLSQAGEMLVPVVSGKGPGMCFKFNGGQTAFTFNVFKYVLKGKAAAIDSDPLPVEAEEDDFWFEEFGHAPL